MLRVDDPAVIRHRRIHTADPIETTCWIPLVGPVLVFLTYVWLVARRYPGDWAAAARIAGIAWLVTAIVLSILATAGFATLEVVGFPDVSGSFPSIP